MVDAKNITKTFIDGETENKVLKGISLQINDGEFVSIMGRSGAGKSTLMYQLSLLDRPTTGEIYLNGNKENFSTASSFVRQQFRLYNLGYIFQQYALMPELTAIENVALPIMMQGVTKSEAYKEATKHLDNVGLKPHLDKLPSQLSGGEQQRVSIARAVAGSTKILFADEPTANLDRENALHVLETLDNLHEKGQTIIMVTHEREYAKFSERIITLDDGKIIKDEKLKH